MEEIMQLIQTAQDALAQAQEMLAGGAQGGQEQAGAAPVDLGAILAGGGQSGE